MKKTVGLFLSLIFVSGELAAAEINRSVQSGKRGLMHEYANWHLANCTPYQGTVKVITKPANGTLVTTSGPYVININRFTGTRSNCAGKTITAFRVYYASKPGFRGKDNFVLEATYRAGLVVETDRFTVDVR
jgi:hypothetical protein